MAAGVRLLRASAAFCFCTQISANDGGGVFDRAVRICLSAALRDALRSRRLGAANSLMLFALCMLSLLHTIA